MGVRYFGAAPRYQPLRGTSTPAQDAISCSVPVAQLTPGRDRQIADALLPARDRLERMLC